MAQTQQSPRQIQLSICFDSDDGSSLQALPSLYLMQIHQVLYFCDRMA